MAAAIACGGSPANTSNTAATGESKPTSATAAPAKAAVETATAPSNPCEWLPAADVEQIAGPLAGSPTPSGSECVYRLAAKSKAFEEEAESMRRLRGIDAKPGATDAGNADRLPDAVKIAVNLSGEVTDERAMEGAAKGFGRAFGPGDPAQTAPQGDTQKPPAGWDDITGLPHTSIARIGHVKISVFAPPEIDSAKRLAIAARVRDRIPDRPFAAENTYQVPDFAAGDKDPCQLLTGAEAEAVLGKLIVDPYRTVRGKPLAFARGRSCAFFTAGHHALMVTPTWSDGADEFAADRGIAALVGMAAERERTYLEGPWDKATIALDGALVFLKGDRLLRVDYATSSTDRAGALKLAAAAIQRLAS